jgi:hypothetical protein
MLIGILRRLNSAMDTSIEAIARATDNNIEALEDMRNMFEIACTDLDADKVGQFLIQNPAVSPAELAKAFDIDESRAQTIIAYITIMSRLVPEFFKADSGAP